MKETLSVILGGGRGARLHPLTSYRSKPAVPLGGKYRLIDIPVSNCLNSGLGKVYVLTQFHSVSLHRHIVHTYRFDHFGQNFVEILAAMQTEHGEEWYEGTADAVRKNLRYIDLPDYNLILILSGDQLYRMDFRKMIAWHKENQADVTIAVLPVERKKASSFGILQVCEKFWIRKFIEKPKEQEVLNELAVTEDFLRKFNIEPNGRTHLASMGIYLFNRDVLVRLLDNTATDFGKEVIPMAIQSHKTLAFLFSGYWEDIGTIKAFYEANLALTEPEPPFDFYDSENPIYTRPRQLPATKVFRCQVDASVLADGCIVEEADIQRCVVGVRSVIRHNSRLRDSVMMGADFYETPSDIQENHRLGRPDVGIGPGCVIKKAIIDKNARIGEAAKILNSKKVQEGEGPFYAIHDGIVVIPKNAIVPAGSHI